MEGEHLGNYTENYTHGRCSAKYTDLSNSPSTAREIGCFYQDMQKDGIISRSKSVYNSPLILVPMGLPPSLPKWESFRVFIDFRKFNQKIQPVSFPIPRIADRLHNAGQTKVISSIDLASAFHQTPIKTRIERKLRSL